MKLAKGWSSLGNGVFENLSLCIRVSLLGGMRLPNNEYLSANKVNNNNNAWRYIKIQGGNRKRGLMLWAENEVNKYHNTRLGDSNE